MLATRYIYTCIHLNNACSELKTEVLMHECESKKSYTYQINLFHRSNHLALQTSHQI